MSGDKRGKFIVFEGGEGSGKSTQVRLLTERLVSRGIMVVMTREPGGTPEAETIRALLVNGAPDRWCPGAELGLFMAARADHVSRLIEPALASGKWVVCDRFLGSSIVYQGIAGGLGIQRVMQAHRTIVGHVYPDLTFVLDVDPAEGLRRKYGQDQALSRFERKGAEYHAQVRSGYHQIRFMYGYSYIESSSLQDVVADIVWNEVSSKLGIDA